MRSVVPHPAKRTTLSNEYKDTCAEMMITKRGKKYLFLLRYLECLIRTYILELVCC